MFPMPVPQSLYSYSPLRQDVDQIRLLIAIENASGPEWAFEHRNLDDHPNFYAISHRWGLESAGPSLVIHVGNNVVEVRDNVIEMLDSLDRLGYHDPIWIDSVCIDQANEGEKMQQIRLMERIYSQASKVLVYLGDDPFAKVELGMLRHMSGENNNFKSTLDLSKVLKSMSEMETGGLQSHVQFNRPLPTILIQEQERICHILSADWWNRLWTMQEYVLARDLVFIYGNTIIEDSMLREYVDYYHALNLAEVEVLMSPLRFRMDQELRAGKFDFSIAPQHDALTALPELQLLRSYRSIQSRDDSSKLKADLCVLTSTFTRQATIPKDKILGLLGLVQTEAIQEHVPNSPATSPQEVFISVARCVLTSHTRKENLALLHYIDTLDRWDTVPSWVPNFNSRLRAPALSPFVTSEDFLYHAAPGPADVRVSDLGAIEVRGIVVDEIVGTVDQDTYAWNYGIPYGMHYSCAAQLKFEKACHQMAADVAARHLSHKVQLESAVLAYFSTLVAGSRHQGTSYARWSPSMRTYRQWMKRMEYLASSNFDIGHDSRNPGTNNMDFLLGRDKNANRAMEVGGEREEFHQRFWEVCKGRLFFSTSRGSLGLGPTKTEKGDLIVLLRGGRTPFILRKSHVRTGGDQAYRVVGEAYVQGIMDGEAYRAMHPVNEGGNLSGPYGKTFGQETYLELE